MSDIMCEVEVSEVSVDEFTSDMVGPYEHYEIDHQGGYEEVTCETEEFVEQLPLAYDVTLASDIYVEQAPEK